MKKMIVDPPEGWRYGFPRLYDRSPDAEETEEEWYLRHGYPKRLIDDGLLKYVRSWEDEDGSG
jgi:hypothetical protein